MAKKRDDGDGKLFDKLWSSDSSVRDEALRNHPNIGGYLPTHTNTAQQDAATGERPTHRSGKPVSRELAAGRNQGRHRSNQD